MLWLVKESAEPEEEEGLEEEESAEPQEEEGLEQGKEGEADPFRPWLLSAVPAPQL